MDVGLRHHNTLLLSKLPEVSILVLVDVGLRPIFPYCLHQPNLVSILVLVDVGLRQGLNHGIL